MQKPSFKHSIGFALLGLKMVLKERHFKWHLVSTSLVAMAGIWLKVSRHDWTILLLCIGLVLGFETMNTAVEKTVDRISLEQHPLSGQIKDLSAAAVLLVSFVAAIIGLMIFWPYFFN
jgi:diacylglycerol kinase (ATP)